MQLWCSDIRHHSTLQTPMSNIVLKREIWQRNVPYVVFMQLWFYGGNVCECFLPKLFPLH